MKKLRRRRYEPFWWLLGAVGATGLLYQLVATLIDELPRLAEGLK